MSDTEGLSETEIAAGCSWSMLDYDNDYDDLDSYQDPSEYDESAQSKISLLMNSSSWKQGAKIIACADDAYEIRKRLTHALVQHGSRRAIDLYLRKEGIPEYYIAVIQSTTCLPTLVRGMLYKICKVIPSRDLEEGITFVCDYVARSSSLVYERVGILRKFIHTRVDAAYGLNSSQRISVKHMKNLLGAARLHLHLAEINTNDHAKIVSIEKLYLEARRTEFLNPTPVKILPGKHYFPHWRVRHLRPLTAYFPVSTLKALKAVDDLNINLNRDEYTIRALTAYAKGARD